MTDKGTNVLKKEQQTAAPGAGEGRYRRLFITADGSRWVIAHEAQMLEDIARRLHIDFMRVPPDGVSSVEPHSCVFHSSQFALIKPGIFRRDVRAAFTYFHGHPETEQCFRDCFEAIRNNHDAITRLRTTYAEMTNLLAETGVAPDKIFCIPLGIRTDWFYPRTAAHKKEIRQQLSLPETAIVIGSFQKDGNGWGEGETPKWVKGPDVFLNTIALLRDRIDELWVLLTGPARGYVKQGLARLGVPFRHVYLDRYEDIGHYYGALDAYLVTSRQEGGPKAVLESMASGIPLITTRVGQATDLVRHGNNAWMVDTGDVEGLAFWTEHALSHADERARICARGIETAREHTYEKQLPLWERFFHGFVEE